MNMPLAIILLVGGLIVLWKCADLLVAGAVGLAKRLGISSLVVGLTVVAMGTSAPEVAASIASVLQEEGGGDLAVGNVFGSNIANLALVGGLIALIRPLVVSSRVLCREVPVMLLAGLLLLPILLDKHVSGLEAIILLAVFSGLMVLLIYFSRKEAAAGKETLIEVADELEKAEQLAGRPLGTNTLFVVVGLAGLAAGAKMTVTGAVFIGKETFGLSDAVIGLTIIAFGTSLPELVTCVVATLKGHHDISVGNLVGSNIFNTLLVTGAAGAVKPFDLQGRRLAGGIDYWIMIAVGVAFAGAAIVGKRTIGRLAGALLVCTYVAYVIYLFYA
ncbi:MAG: calcium/sodium antiporter [Planctomycetota bacterium]|jgi:cation:H+ antiporter